jgi:hypothetical protein
MKWGEFQTGAKVMGIEISGEKRPFPLTFLIFKRYFTKTGSGQT